MWSPSPINFIKCNVDVAIFPNGAGYGVVLRDAGGNFVEAKSGPWSAALILILRRNKAYNQQLVPQFIIRPDERAKPQNGPVGPYKGPGMWPCRFDVRQTSRSLGISPVNVRLSEADEALAIIESADVGGGSPCPVVVWWKPQAVRPVVEACVRCVRVRCPYVDLLKLKP
nr:uncharacterized protein LOC109179181 [Ipomoea trifida]